MSAAAQPLATKTTVSRQPFPLTDDACRRLLVVQLAARKEREVAASAAAWATQLRTEGPVWQLIGVRVAPALAQWLSTIHTLVGVLNSRPPVDARPRYREWLVPAQQLAAAWPPSDLPAWESLLAASPMRDNLLLRAIVARVLGDGLAAVSVPKAVGAPLLTLLRADLKFAAEVALPPSAAARAEAAEYVFAAEQETGWPALQLVAVELREALAKANQAQERLRMGGTSAAAPPPANPITRDLAVAVGELEKLLALGSSGWPILKGEVLRQRLGLRELLVMAKAATRDPWALSDDRLPHWIESLTPPTVTPSADAAPSPADSLSDLPQPAELSPPAADAPAEPHPLSRLIDRLASDSDPRARQFAVRLQPLANLPFVPAAGTGPAPSLAENRKLLACLIYLDELAQQEQGSVAWIASAREVLRGLIDQLGVFVVLDGQLVGKTLIEVAKLVAPIGYVPTRRVPAGNIGKVQQPGYAIRSAGRIGDVICQAKILIARPPTSA
jgi:hypothetical protein